jgi:nucleotide-binding universal stress UspA family protein
MFMLPFKRIFCPTDFSDPAQAALTTVIELAKHFSAQIHLVHVVPPVPVPYQPIDSPAPVFDVTTYLQELVKASREALQAFAAKRVPGDIPVIITVAAGDPAFEILRLAKELEADVIVIATHGHGGWRQFLFGSVAEKVVRQAEIPVLVVHAPSEYKHPAF